MESSSLSTLFKVDFLAFRGVAGAFFFTGEAVVLFVIPVPVLLFFARKPLLREVRRLNADPVFVYPVSLATASKSVWYQGLIRTSAEYYEGYLPFLRCALCS
jgi:hypothetical protein